MPFRCLLRIRFAEKFLKGACARQDENHKSSIGSCEWDFCQKENFSLAELPLRAKIQTVDADATMETECLPACGSFSCSAAAADAAATHLAATDAATTAACGSSFCSAAAADSAAMDADADQF